MRTMSRFDTPITIWGGLVMNRRFAIRVCAGLVALSLALGVVDRGASANGNVASIKAQDLKEWLTYIASDELEGRAVFTAGIGLAAAYIEDHLQAWGVKPGGDRGSYLQTVRVLGVRATRHSSVTVEVSGQTRTFADGQGVAFAP